MTTGTTSTRWKARTWRVALVAAALAAGWGSRAWMGSESPAGSAAAASASTPAKPSAAERTKEAEASRENLLRTAHGNTFERETLAWADKLDAPTIEGMIPGLISAIDSDRDADIVDALIARLVALNPQAAMAVVKKISNPMEKYIYAIGLFDAWSAKDPAAALAAFPQLPSNEQNVHNFKVREAIAENLVDEDPSTVTAALSSFPGDGMADYLAKDVFEKWGERDAAGSLNAALDLPPGATRSGALQGAVSGWAEQDPTAALAWAQALPATQKADAVQAVLETMSEQDPQAAADYALQNASGQERATLIDRISDEWAKSDPAGLIAWANDNLTGSSYSGAIAQSLYQMSLDDPAAAAAAFDNVTDGRVRSVEAKLIGEYYAKQDPGAAMQWAQALPADNTAVRNSAVASVLNSWLRNDPGAAGAYVQQNFTGDPAFSMAAAQMADKWGAADPQAALAWVQSLPAGEAQNGAMAAAVAQLAKQDPQAAAAAAQSALNLAGLTTEQQAALQKLAAKTPGR